MRALLLMGLMLLSSPAQASPSAVADDAGNVGINDLIAPLSEHLSPEARRAVTDRLIHPYPPMRPVQAGAPIAALRQQFDDFVFKANLALVSAAYPVDVEVTNIGGVPVEIVRPKTPMAARNRDRVLISLHSGGFLVGGGAGAIAAAIPIAATMGVTVISVEYRMAPEYRYPAATEDVVRVYSSLLKSHRAARIGLYGCSAGGLLAAQTVVALHMAKLPRPGAVAVMCAGVGGGQGDSDVIGPALTASILPPMSLEQRALSYAATAHATDPAFAPVNAPALLALFPPTLVITSTRGSEMSEAVYFHGRLTAAGATAELHVWDGLGHAFFDSFGNPGLPESKAAFDVVCRFFDRYLAG